jgi:hypothetical protein
MGPVARVMDAIAASCPVASLVAEDLGTIATTCAS